LPAPPASVSRFPAKLRPRRLAVLLVFVGLLLLTGRWLDARIERRAQSLGRTWLQGRVDVASVSSYLLLTRFTVRGFSWTAPDGTRILAARRVAVNYSLLSLLGRGIVLDRLELEGVDADLVRAADGTWGIVHAIPALARTGAPARIFVNHIMIKGGRIRVEDQRAGTGLTLEGVSADSMLRLPRLRFATRTEVSGATIRRPSGTQQLGPLRVAAHMEREALMIDHAEVLVHGSRVRVDGRVDDVPALSGLDLRVRGEVKAEDLHGIDPMLHRFEGKARVSARVRGTALDPRAEGSVRAGAGEIYGVAINDLAARFTLARSQVRVAKLDVLAFGGKLDGHGAVRPASLGYTFDLRCREVRGKRLLGYLLPRPLFDQLQNRLRDPALEREVDRLDGTIRLEGNGFALSRMEGSAALLFRTSVRPDAPLATDGGFLLDALIRMNRGDILFKRLRLDSSELRVRVGSASQGESLRYGLSAAQVDFPRKAPL